MIFRNDGTGSGYLRRNKWNKGIEFDESIVEEGKWQERNWRINAYYSRKNKQTNEMSKKIINGCVIII